MEVLHLLAGVALFGLLLRYAAGAEVVEKPSGLSLREFMPRRFRTRTDP